MAPRKSLSFEETVQKYEGRVLDYIRGYVRESGTTAVPYKVIRAFFHHSSATAFEEVVIRRLENKGVLVKVGEGPDAMISVLATEEGGKE